MLTTSPSGYENTGSLKSITSRRGAVMSIGTAIMSICLTVSAGISARNGIGCIPIRKPASLATASSRSIITPWMVCVRVSRNVNGFPVRVAPTL